MFPHSSSGSVTARSKILYCTDWFQSRIKVSFQQLSKGELTMYSILTIVCFIVGVKLANMF